LSPQLVVDIKPTKHKQTCVVCRCKLEVKLPRLVNLSGCKEARNWNYCQQCGVLYLEAKLEQLKSI
jgi:hypothetical protein